MSRNFIKKQAYIFLSLLLAIFIGERLLCRFLFLQTTSQPSWDIPYTPPQIEEIRTILKQPLRFLGAGSQCFAFVSEDDQYVIKICKAMRYQKPEKKEADFLSYFLAFQKLPKQSQMLFLHLNPTNTLQISLKIIDPLGIPHFVNADHLSFYIQKKLTLFYDYLNPLVPTMSIDQAKNLLHELLALCRTSSKEALQVRDIQLKNIGVCHDKFFWVDPGRIRKKNSLPSLEEQKKEFIRLTSRLKPFLESLHPLFSSIIDEEIQKELETITNPQIPLQDPPQKEGS